MKTIKEQLERENAELRRTIATMAEDHRRVVAMLTRSEADAAARLDMIKDMHAWLLNVSPAYVFSKSETELIRRIAAMLSEVQG